MGPARWSRQQAAVVIGIPTTWAFLFLLHPGGDGTQIYSDLDGDGTRMLVVHIETMVVIPLLFIAAVVMTSGAIRGAVTRGTGPAGSGVSG